MRLSVNKILEMKANNDKITMLTCTDASFAKLLDDEGIDIFLIGDSLGMVIQGFDSTIPVVLMILITIWSAALEHQKEH